MTCSMMLDRMLEADVHELSGRGETDIASHVRACPRCRAVAEALVRDTDELSRAVRATRTATTVRRRRLAAVPARVAAMTALAGLAAAVAVIVLRRADRPTGSHTAAGAPVVAQLVAVMPPVVARGVGAAPDAPPLGATRRPSNRVARVARPTGRAIRPSAVTVEPTVVASAQRAVAVLPVRIVPPPRQPLGNTVTAEPPAGRRANIIPTDRPGVTVVWLYRVGQPSS